MATYESEFTQFLKQLKSERPNLEAEQRTGRSIWWDKGAIDLEQSRQWRDARVPMAPYPYQTKT
jgi:hypothetical protein